MWDKIKSFFQNSRISVKSLALLGICIVLVIVSFFLNRKQGTSSALPAPTETPEATVEPTATPSAAPDEVITTTDRGEDNNEHEEGREANEDTDTSQPLQVNANDDDSICKAVSDFLNQDGTYSGASEKAMMDDTHYIWQITDLSYRASENPNYQNLWQYGISVMYAEETTTEFGDGSEITHKPGDQTWLNAYATKNEDGTATIHMIEAGTSILLDDNYVPRDVDQ